MSLRSRFTFDSIVGRMRAKGACSWHLLSLFRDCVQYPHNARATESGIPRRSPLAHRGSFSHVITIGRWQAAHLDYANVVLALIGSRQQTTARIQDSFIFSTDSRARFRNSALLSPDSSQIGAPIEMQLSKGTGRNSPLGITRFKLSM